MVRAYFCYAGSEAARELTDLSLVGILDGSPRLRAQPGTRASVLVPTTGFHNLADSDVEAMRSWLRPAFASCYNRESGSCRACREMPLSVTGAASGTGDRVGGLRDQTGRNPSRSSSNSWTGGSVDRPTWIACFFRRRKSRCEHRARVHVWRPVTARSDVRRHARAKPAYGKDSEE